MDDRLRKRSVKSGIIPTMQKLTNPAEDNNLTLAFYEIALKILTNLGQSKLQAKEFKDLGNNQVERISYTLFTSPKQSKMP